MVVVVLWGSLLRAQSTNVFDLRVTATYVEVPFPEVLADLENRLGIKFYYIPAKVPFYPINAEFKDQSLYLVMKKLLDGSLLTISRWAGKELVLVPEDFRNRAFVTDMVAKWRSGEWKPPILSGVVEKNYSFGDPSTAAAKVVELNGRVIDQESNEPILGATLLVRELGTGVETDANGQFELRLAPGRYTLQVNYLGYQTQLNYLALYAPGFLDLRLQVLPQQLNEVLIKAEQLQRGAAGTNPGVERLSPRLLQELPTLMGEADVIKSLQTLPGVTNAGEGVAGFNVRGGNIDQNLILQDGATLFNSAHALGFFSIFNADAVQQINLYKGHLPAQYGGRLASVLDVQLKDGDMRKWVGKGSVGAISSRFLAEGPLVSDKLSLLVGARVSYLGPALQLFNSIPVRSSAAGFQDLVTRLFWRLDARNTLRFTGFLSGDTFRYGSDFGYGWYNRQASILWSRVHSENFSSKAHLSFGAYRAEQNDPSGNDAFTLTNGLDNWKIKLDNRWLLGKKHLWQFGLEANHYAAQPEAIDPIGTLSVILPQRVTKGRGRELALFWQDEFTWSEKITLTAGLRWSGYQNLGPGTVWRYAPGTPRETQTIVDSTNYGPGAVLATYSGFEPRFALKYQLAPRQSLKLSYNRARQYIHLTSNTVAPTPVDVWQVSTPYLPPQIGDQVSLGWFSDAANQRWEFSVEFYHKWIKNLLEYKDLPDLLLNPRLETELLAGQGRAYGGEVSLRKTQGKFTGWLSYAYARSLARVVGPSASETINGGDWFPANFDKPHQVSWVGRLQVNPTNSFAFNFSYSTGRPISIPISSYRLGSGVWINFSERNQYRIPDYHRLDVSYTIDNRQTRLKGFRGSFTVSLYNLYGRANPFSIFFRRNENGRPAGYQLAVVGSVIPALAYNFTF